MFEDRIEQYGTQLNMMASAILPERKSVMQLFLLSERPTSVFSRRYIDQSRSILTRVATDDQPFYDCDAPMSVTWDPHVLSRYTH